MAPSWHEIILGTVLLLLDISLLVPSMPKVLEGTWDLQAGQKGAVPERLQWHDLSRRLCDAATEVATGGRLGACSVMELQRARALPAGLSLATH